mmetsp:Transcript_18094/g.49343  ORF Transcript_18094/g.49343 Transcript_18094/m.49343 type:complete len:249 (-) Transcript_18094:1244-1990(-)
MRIWERIRGNRYLVIFFLQPRVFVKQLQCIQDTLVHVEVFVVGQPTDEGNIFGFVRQLFVLFKQLLILLVGHWVVRISAVLGMFVKEYRVWLVRLVQVVLVFHNTRIVVFGCRMVDNGQRLEEFGIHAHATFKVQTPVFQFFPFLLCVKIVNGPGEVNSILALHLVLDIEVVHIELVRDVLVIQKLFKKLGVAPRRQGLILVGKVAVIVIVANGDACCHFWPKVTWFLGPLFDGVGMENQFVQTLAHT